MRKLAVLTTTAAIALLGAASAENANAPAAESAAAPAAAPASGPLRAALNAYAAFHSDITELRGARVGAAAELESAIDVASRHNREALTRGWVAYGAYTAAQSPAFVQGVRDAASYYGRDAVIWAITADTSYARGLRGGNEATRLVLDAANADGARIIAVADRYQELAYSLQRQRWANSVAPQQAARVQRVRTNNASAATMTATLPADVGARLSVTPASLSPGADPTAFGGRRFWDSVRGGAQVTEVSAPVSYQWRLNHTRGEAVNRMTAIAALQALDAVETNAPAVERLMTDPRSKDCIEMANLQLYQCMSAARFRYENAFCMSQHAIRDIGQCISAVAQPETTAMTPVAAPGNRH